MAGIDAKTAEVIVVGAGNAALAAALSAAESNVQVLVLEKARRGERGGNTAISSGIFRHIHNGKSDIMRLVDGVTQREWKNISVRPYRPRKLYDEVMELSKGRADPILSKTWINNSYTTVAWMKEALGVEFILNNNFTSKPSGTKQFLGPEVVRAKAGGPGLSSRLFSKCETNQHIRIQYGAAVDGLIIAAGTVKGVRAKVNGKRVELKSRAVVLGSGGFEASKSLRSKFMGPRWRKAKVRGTRHNDGRTLLAAMKAGAELYGDMSGCHATQIDLRSSEYGNLKLGDRTSRYSWQYGVLVNKGGRRFADEGEDFIEIAYAKLGKRVLEQKDAVAYQVFDQKTAKLLEKDYKTMSPITALSLAQLGAKIDIDAAQLQKTIEEFNAKAGKGPFNPKVKDGCSTRGISPQKTNWAQPLNNPPFVVYPVTCGVTFTYGGIRINEKAKVMRGKGGHVKGLYAAGEITGGFFYGGYPRGSGLTRGAVFGRIAGMEAAKFACGDMGGKDQ